MFGMLGCWIKPLKLITASNENSVWVAVFISFVVSVCSKDQNLIAPSDFFGRQLRRCSVSCQEWSGCWAVTSYNPTSSLRHKKSESFHQVPAALWVQCAASIFTGREISQGIGTIWGWRMGNQQHNGMKENPLKYRNKEQVTGNGTWPHSSSALGPKFVQEKYHKANVKFISASEKPFIKVLLFSILAGVTDSSDFWADFLSSPHFPP